HALFDARTLYLHHHVFAGMQRGGVYLRDRSRGQALHVEARETLGERAAEIRFDDAADGVERFRRNLIAARLELVNQLFRKQAAAGRDGRAEVDVGRPEPLEGTPEPA